MLEVTKPCKSTLFAGNPQMALLHVPQRVRTRDLPDVAVLYGGHCTRVNEVIIARSLVVDALAYQWESSTGTCWSMKPDSGTLQSVRPASTCARHMVCAQLPGKPGLAGNQLEFLALQCKCSCHPCYVPPCSRYSSCTFTCLAG